MNEKEQMADDIDNEGFYDWLLNEDYRRYDLPDELYYMLVRLRNDVLLVMDLLQQNGYML